MLYIRRNFGFAVPLERRCSFFVKRPLCFLLLLMAAICLLSGCTGNSRKEKTAFAVIAPGSDEYSAACAEEICRTIQEAGYVAASFLPDDCRAESQLEMIQKAAKENKYSWYVISPVAISVMQKDIATLNQEGIRIICYDEIAQESDAVTLQICEFPTGQIGGTFLDLVESLFPEDQQIQIAVMQQNGFIYNQMQYSSDIRTLLEAGSYPNIVLTEISYAQENQKKIREKTDHLLESFPDLDVIITTTLYETKECCAYLNELELGNTVQVIGFADSKIKDQYFGKNLGAGILSDPAEFGRFTGAAVVFAAAQLSNSSADSAASTEAAASEASSTEGTYTGADSTETTGLPSSEGTSVSLQEIIISGISYPVTPLSTRYDTDKEMPAIFMSSEVSPLLFGN